MRNAIRFEIMLVTREIAEHFLRGNTRNRTIKRNWFYEIRKAVVDGDFVLTHQGIAVAPDGELIDGQHRLRAIVESGVAAWLVVAYYVDQKVADAARLRLDGGIKRDLGDTLQLLGQLPDRGRDRVTVARLIQLLESGNSHIDTSDAMRVAAEFIGDHSAIRAAMPSAPSIQIAPFVWCRRMDHDRIDELVRRLHAGVGLTEYEVRLQRQVAEPTGGGGHRLAYALRVLRCIENVFRLDGRTGPLVRVQEQDREQIVSRFNARFATVPAPLALVG